MADLLANTQRRRSGLIALLLLVASSVAGGLMLRDLHRGDLHPGLADLALALAALGLLRALRRIPVAVPLILAVLLSVAVLRLGMSQMPHELFVWLPGAPLMAYLLLDRWSGFWMSLALISAGVAALSLRLSAQPELLEALAVGHVLGVSVLALVCSHASAWHREHRDLELERKALTDPLTELSNRRALLQAFERERRRAVRARIPLALVLVDLDHFKHVNDRLGHEAGDVALRFVAQLLRRGVRQNDTVARFGGEEFVLLLPGSTAAEAVTVAEKLRRALAESVFHYHGEKVPLALSAGVAEWGRDGDDWQQLFRSADARLLACKEAGRNRVLSEVPASAA